MSEIPGFQLLSNVQKVF